jgi:serine/threonine protein kinase
LLNYNTMTTEWTINNKYRVIDHIGAGSFGSIYKGQNMRTMEDVAIKVEPIDGATKLLKNESVVYQYLKNSVGVPCVKWFGHDDKNYYMVINLLGESLETVKNKHQTLSLNLVLKIGIQIILLLENIHGMGLIHRDVKPDNFLFGRNNDKNRIHIIDFGFCKSYLIDGRHIPERKTHGMIGSLTYASLNTHSLTELSRRDDLESLGYMMSNLYLGKLPWHDITAGEVANAKRLLVTNDRLPRVIVNFLTYTWNLKFEETPEYAQIIKSFTSEIV